MVPDRFGRYEVLAEIGEGAMGRVYRGFDPLARRHVAIKTMRSELLAKNTAAEYVRRFRREAQAAGALTHPNVTTIYDVGEDYFVMELLEGETLQALLDRRVRLELHEALAILQPIADALDHAHRHGIVHRDIKPANVMVLTDGRPKLMDFGVVHVESTVMTVAGQSLGSPLYMAPEQISGGDVTGKTDLFALAAVAYEMLTGRRAFAGQSITSIIYRVMNDDPPPPRRWNVDLPPHYDDVFARALAKDPAARYATASEFVGALTLRDIDHTLHAAFSTLVAPSDDAAGAGAARPVGLETHDLGGTVDGDVLGVSTRPVVSATVAASASAVPPAPRRIGRAAAITAPLLLLALPAAFALLPRAPEVPPASPVTRPPTLSVETEPEGAQVFLDEEPVGLTPLAIAGVSPGPHVVRVMRDGYAPAQLAITLTTQGVPPLHFVLQPATVELHVDSEPPDANVLLDGRRVGQTPITGLAIGPGPHAVRVERAGYLAWTSTFDAVLGQPARLSARLKHAPTPRPTVVPVREGDLVELGPGVTPPRKISGATASYPDEAVKKKQQGRVTVEFTVDPAGVPSDFTVVESVGEALDRAVVAAFAKWRYEPATKDGVKVRVRIREWQSFELRKR